MITDKMQKALNEQINAEAYSAYLYMAMAAYFEDMGLKGMAHWMSMQAREETFHSLKFFNFLNERKGRVELMAIDAPPKAWSSPLEAFEEAYKHEQYVTKRINDLVTQAKADQDHATEIFLQWFVTEQVEEEAAADEIVNKLKLIGREGPGLFMVNNELSQRTLSPLVSAALLGNAASAE